MNDKTIDINEVNENYSQKDFQYEENEEKEKTELRRYQINSYAVDRAIETLIKWKQKGKMIVPEFQRDFVWTYGNCCRFIDSVLLNLPIPNIFVFKTLEEGVEKYILVDGMQRVTTLEQFYNGVWEQGNKTRKFKINIKSSNWYNKAFSDLEDDDKEFFLDYSLSVMIFETSANSETEANNVIFSVFERINTGSDKLTEQEIRNTIFQGECLTKLKELSENNQSYINLIDLDKSIQKRGKNIEFLLRILTYYEILETNNRGSIYLIDGVGESKITTSKTVMLNNYLSYANSGKIEYISKLNDIVEALEIINNVSSDAFYSVKRDKSGIGAKVHQIFSEALVIAIIKNNFKVNISPEEFNKNKIELWKSEEYFYTTFTEKTTEPNNVAKRINEMVKFINGEEIWN